MKKWFPMHEGANKIMDERDEAIAAAHRVPPTIAGFVFTHHDDCYLRYDFDPKANCNCFNWEHPKVTDNVITLSEEELEKIKRSLADLKAGRVVTSLEPLPIEDAGFKLIDPDPGYTYKEWTAYMDGLISGLKAAERTEEDE